MKVKVNPRYQIFLDALKAQKRPYTKWEGIAFRATPLEFARLTKLLDGMGSFAHGGRWSAPGTFPATNLSLTQETAIRESSSNFSYYNLSPLDVRPKLLVGIRLKLLKVIDLRKRRWKHSWLQLHELLSEDWRKINDRGYESQSQAFGRASYDFGAEAVFAPSARVHGGLNVVYFPRTILPPSEVTIIAQDEIERWLKVK